MTSGVKRAKKAKIKWYMRNVEDALEGMEVLTLEERGAYNTVLDLIYFKRNRLRDDPALISGHCRCSVRKWNLIRQRLLELGKLYVDNSGGDPILRNPRADIDVETALSSIESAISHGSVGGQISAERRRTSSNNNGVAQPPPQGTPQGSPQQTKTKKEINTTDRLSSVSEDGRAAQPVGLALPSSILSPAQAEPLNRLRDLLEPAVFAAWFEEPGLTVEPDSTGKKTIIAHPKAFAANWINAHFTKELNTVYGRDRWTVVAQDQKPAPASKPAAPVPDPKTPAGTPTPEKL